MIIAKKTTAAFFARPKTTSTLPLHNQTPFPQLASSSFCPAFDFSVLRGLCFCALAANDFLPFLAIFAACFWLLLVVRLGYLLWLALVVCFGCYVPLHDHILATFHFCFYFYPFLLPIHLHSLSVSISIATMLPPPLTINQTK